MNRTHLALVFTLGIFLLPIIFLIWDENVDPPFISNSIYDFLIYKLIPVLAGLFSIILFAFSYRKYKSCSHYQQTLKYQFEEQGKLRSTLGMIFLPVLVYGWIWAAIGAPIKLWAYYSVNEYWSQEYHLSEVESCGSDYEYECTRLTLLDLETNKKHSVRWYYDKSSLMKVKKTQINIIGEQGYFGYIINGLEW
ncbi:hypothetical protein [Pseudoalteromonas nigrifaciens]|uniref:hypothetical protein n=1 Tax=Pseudoalteromonas nigrifaciens TaxID=28109 RepID=UPI003FB6E03F